MTEAKTPALLPTGLRDLLPPEAGAEAALAEALLARFGAHGYERVKPPFVEFEDSMLSGAGAGLARPDLPPDGPGVAPHDGRAQRSHAADRAHRSVAACQEPAAASPELCRRDPAGAGQRAQA